MDRRTFVHLGGSAVACGGLACSAVDDAALRLPEPPGDTSDDRKRYCAAMLDLLCTICGPRPAGSAGYDRAADIIRSDLARPVHEVSLDTYTFERWEPAAPPVMTVGDEPVAGFYGIGCESTPPGGVTGILRVLEEGRVRYGIVDPATGNLLAYVAPSPRGNAPRARSVGPFGLEPHCPPLVIVGTHAGTILDEAVERELPVTLTASTRFTPDIPTSNIVGTIPGSSTDEVLFVAHLDTVYPSPGANDNAASLILVLLLAHALAGTTPRHTLRFIASADEETGSHGMEHYIKRRREGGTVDRIIASINIDSATWGPDIAITSRDEATRAMFLDIDRDLKLPGRPVVSDGNIYTMDNRWFETHPLVNAITVGSRGYDNIEFCWHRPNDIPENVPLECVEIAYRLFREYLVRTEDV